MSTIIDKAKQIESLKQRIEGLDKGRLHYEIFAFIPETGNDFQLYYKGSNKGSQSIYEQFCHEIDSLLGNSSVVRIKVKTSNGRKNSESMGETEIVLKDAYPKMVAPLQPLHTLKPEAAKPEAPADKAADKAQEMGLSAQMAEMFGLAFLGESGLGGIGEQLGVTGMLLKGQEHTMNQRFEREKQAERVAELMKQNGILEQKILILENENEKLKSTLDKYEDRIDDLEEEIKEYERINPKRNMISGIASEIASGALMGVIKKSPVLAGLFGEMNDVEETQPQQYQPTAPQYEYQAPQAVTVQEVVVPTEEYTEELETDEQDEAIYRSIE